MSNHVKGSPSGELLKVLTAHFHSLVSARCDDEILQQYSALLRFLRSGKCKVFESASRSANRATPSRQLPLYRVEELNNASLDQLEKVVSNEATPRKDLEWIAISRFSVPRGSMRSFSNRQMLVDKLRTLIGNERAHETISSVARGK